MRLLVGYTESCFLSVVYTVCHLFHTWFYPWFQTTLHPPNVPPESLTFLFSLSCSGQKPSNYPWLSLSFTSSSYSISNSTFEINLDSDYFSTPLMLPPTLIFLPDYWTSRCPASTCPFPSTIFFLTINVVLWKGKNHVISMSPVPANHDWPPSTFPPLKRPSPAHSLCSCHTSCSGNRTRLITTPGLCSHCPFCLSPEPCGSFSCSGLSSSVTSLE